MKSAGNLQFGIMSAGQEFAVSAVSAALSHVIHHPLYTLKSQMMFYGPEFKFRMFFGKAKEHKTFLYRGEYMSNLHENAHTMMQHRCKNILPLLCTRQCDVCQSRYLCV